MTTVSELIEKLQKLEDEGHGDLPIYAVHGASGVAYELSSAFLRDAEYTESLVCEIDTDEDGNWVEIYAGN